MLLLLKQRTELWVSDTILQSINAGDKAFEPRHHKTNKKSVRPAKTLISLGIRVFAGRTCHFVGFVMSRLIPIRQEGQTDENYSDFKELRNKHRL